MKLICLFSFLFSFHLIAAEKDCLLQLNDSKVTLCAGINWTQGLEEQKTINLELMFWDKDDFKQTLVDPELNFFSYLWMYMDNGVQHGSRSLEVKKISDGKYAIKGLFLIPMRGYWTFQIALSSDQIPQITSLPVNKKPVAGKLFKNKYDITDNAQVRFDFAKFNKFAKKAFIVWKNYSVSKQDLSFKVFFQEMAKSTIIELDKMELGATVLNSTFSVEQTLTFSPINASYFHYQSEDFSLSKGKKKTINLTLLSETNEQEHATIKIND